MMTRKSMIRGWVLVLLAAWSAVALFTVPTRADSIEDEYVRQVLEEDQQHYNDHYANEDDYYEKNNNNNNNNGSGENDFVDEEQRRRDAEAHAAKEASDRVAAQRERKFQADLERMEDVERKAALKQKKTDGRKVKAVLKAAGRNDLYKVLGLRNYNLRIPARKIGIPGVFQCTIPGLTILGEATDKQIRKQFRKQAMQVHPDKNRDGRAQEAFVAVDEAAAILSDPRQRKLYDADRKQYRSEQLESQKRMVANLAASAWALLRKMVSVVQKLLGPFFVPVTILVALII